MIEHDGHDISCERVGEDRLLRQNIKDLVVVQVGWRRSTSVGAHRSNEVNL